MIFLLSATLWAHKPSFGPYSSAETPFEVTDPNISIVVYQEITCEDQEIWFSFEAQEGFPLYVQVGVPVVDRLNTYMPHAAIIAPGLPEPTTTLPFSVPEGLGVMPLSPDETPSDFYEPFTQTSSWVWIEETVTLPESGSAYIVAWNEDSMTGKLWLATGTVEDFSDVEVSEFILWNEYVNNFHETGRFEPVLPKEESSCALETEQAEAGCAQSKAFFVLWPILFLFHNRKKI